MLTSDQIKKYVDSGGLNCPYCGSEDITGGFVQTEAGHAWQPVDCVTCRKSWADVYRLENILEEEEN